MGSSSSTFQNQESSALVHASSASPPKCQIGLDERVKEFDKRVLMQRQSGKPHVVGIVGLAGIGKTTLARELITRKNSSFNGNCPLFDVRKTVDDSSLHFLQSKLLESFTKMNTPIESVDQGKEQFTKYASFISRATAFITLDNVDEAHQLEALLPVQNFLPHESLILITSRSKDVLTDYGIEQSSIYSLTGLNWPQSQELFCRNAFKQVDPLPDYEDLVDGFVTALNGLPSKLESYGTYLGKNLEKSHWENILEELNIEKAIYWCGLNRKVRDLEKVSLQQQREHPQAVGVVGVVGSSGEGKTTLVKEFFKRKSSFYGKSCILYDVSTPDPFNLLSELLKRLNQVDLQVEGLTESDLQVQNLERGEYLFKKHVSSKSLVILDNVYDRDQLDQLLRVLAFLPSDSLILITSLHEDLLNRVKDSSIYKLNGLQEQYGRQLFCLHAFSRHHTDGRFKDLVDKFVKECDGLPLTLKVFGALLRGKERSYWRKQLGKLQQSSKNIQKILEISYDALTTEEQKMFLYIACLPTPEKKGLIASLRDGSSSTGLSEIENLQKRCACLPTPEKKGLIASLRDGSSSTGLSEIENLQKRCLVEVDSEGFIIMHEHFRKLGSTIAGETGWPRPLRPPKEKNPDLLQQTSEFREKQGFMIMILKIMMALMVSSIVLTIILLMMIWRMGQGS